MARIQPLEAGLKRPPGAPAAVSLAGWTAAGRPARRRRAAAAVIPGTSSGFHSREAYVYLPPAYQARPRPALPVLVLFSGQPGSPGRLAHRRRPAEPHGPLRGGSTTAWPRWWWWWTRTVPPPATPSAWTAGSPRRTPSSPRTCRPGSTGRWTWTRIPRQWAAGGFSFGATCAMQMVTRHPDVYSSALAFSSEKEPALAKERRKDHRRHPSAATPRPSNGRHRCSSCRSTASTGTPSTSAPASGTPSSSATWTCCPAAARNAGFTVEARRIPNAGHSWETASKGLPGGPGLPGHALGDPAMSPETASAATREYRGASLLGLGAQGVRRSLGHFRAVPFTLAVLAVFLVTGAATGSFLSGPPESLLDVASVSAPGPEGRPLVVPVHLAVLRDQPAGLPGGRADDPARCWASPSGSWARVRTAVFYFAGQFAAVTLFLLLTQLARYAGDGWLGLMVDARLIGPYAGGPRRHAGVPAGSCRRCGSGGCGPPVVSVVAAAGAVRRARGDRRRARRCAGGAGGGLVDPGRQGHAAPPPLHRPRNPQPAGPDRGDLRRRPHPDGRGQEPHRAAGPAAGRRPESAAHAEPAGAELRRHRRRHLPGGRPAGFRRARWASRWRWSRWCCC